MTRRVLILAVPQTIVGQADPFDELAKVWNPFAQKRNAGVLDLKLWKKVVAQVDRIEGRNCSKGVK